MIVELVRPFLENMQHVVAALPIHRPYGIAGPSNRVRFGGSNTAQLAEVAQNIRTFTEQVTDNTALDGMKAALENADRIVFLGFAFHRQNLTLLECTVHEGAEVLATSYGISRSDCEVISREVCEAFEIKSPVRHQEVELANVKCNQFFKEYWRTLTAGPQQ